MSTWNATMLLVHLAAFAGVVILYRAAPCWMQKVTMVGLGIAMALASTAFALALIGFEHHRWPIFLLALVIEHLAVLLYVFRLVYRDHLEWNHSSANSPSLSR